MISLKQEKISITALDLLQRIVLNKISRGVYS